ncbi:YbfB/YjiJ family MFS transporter [Devosia sp.]|uniref:YbfB/YjiJ family MFS transporter n=1 Tax=Devosia sp. TaxID=1871048 RepID=UPI001AC70030|nr:YbfB/YjiJ family MFS transporter [Devosia sp.]MBN9334457.1 YbfB/YjiJ family MFS transporter [Devosia sp.]
MIRSERLAEVAAALVLVVGMGFGRFAFTGLYPLMVADGQLSLTGGSYAASANYAGYLVGALLTAALSSVPSRMLCAVSIAATALTLALLALPQPEWLLVVIRGLSGVASAVTMVAASRWLLSDRGQHNGSPALFSGVGIGILFSAEVIAAGSVLSLSSWSIWLLLGLACLVCGGMAIVIQVVLEREKRSGRDSPRDEDRPGTVGARRLIVIYGLAGFGYIVTATYLPLLVKEAIAPIDPVHVWAIFGAAAIPSCFLWHRLYRQWGTNLSLCANLIVQGIGVALPLLHAPVPYLLSALLVGGTFMGTVTIAMPAARRVAHMLRFNILAIMTAAYGLGQIIGPLIASYLFAQTQAFDASLAVAAVVLMLAAALSFPAVGTNRSVASFPPSEGADQNRRNG